MGDFDALLDDPQTVETLAAEPLGDLLGVSGRTVRELATRGVLTRRNGQYGIRESVRAYTAHLREQASGRGGAGSANLTQERIRVAREQGDALAMKNATARGEMLPARAVESAWGDVLRSVRSGMLSLPSRVHQELGHLTPHDVAAIDRAVRTLLEETANG